MKKSIREREIVTDPELGEMTCVVATDVTALGQAWHDMYDLSSQPDSVPSMWQIEKEILLWEKTYPLKILISAVDVHAVFKGEVEPGAIADNHRLAIKNIATTVAEQADRLAEALLADYNHTIEVTDYSSKTFKSTDSFSDIQDYIYSFTIHFGDEGDGVIFQVHVDWEQEHGFERVFTDNKIVF